MLAANSLIQPNLHIALVHFPIALLAIGTAIEVFCFLGWRRSSFRTAGRWMILLGALCSMPVAFSGLYAMVDVMARSGAPDGYTSFAELKSLSAVHADESAWRHLERHLWLQVAATGAAMLVVLLWIACSDVWRRTLRLSLTLLLVAAVTVTLIGAHVGGKLVYEHGVGVKLPQVADDAAAADASIKDDVLDRAERAIDVVTPAPVPREPAPASPTTTTPSTQPTTRVFASTQSADESPTTLPAVTPTPAPGPVVASDVEPDRLPGPDADPTPAALPRALEMLEPVVPLMPPLQMHMLGAGFSISLSLVAIALAIRRWSELDTIYPDDPPPTAEQRRIAAVFSRPADIEPDIDSPWSPPPAPTMPTRTVPPARFFMLACVVALITSTFGWWHLARETETINPLALWEQVVAPMQNVDADNKPVTPTRRLAHSVAGVAIIVLPLLLAALTRILPRSRLMLIALSLLLVVVLAAQVWLGTLLLLDTNIGPVTGFQPALID